MNVTLIHKVETPMLIQDIRVGKLLSQVQLAKLAGIAPSTIVRLETGKPVSSDTLNAVCEALGISPTEVTGVNLFVPVRDRRSRAKNG